MSNLLMEAEEHQRFSLIWLFSSHPLNCASSVQCLDPAGHQWANVIFPLSSSFELPQNFTAYVTVVDAGDCGTAVSVGRKVEDECPGKFISPSVV